MTEQRTRIGVYAFSVSDSGLLLCRIAKGEMDAGRWTLPGGGIDFGEHPEDALRREVYEETGLVGDVRGIMGIDSRHLAAGRRPGAPELHAIWIVYRVDLEGAPRVTERDGSVDLAAWIGLSDLAALPKVDLVDFALSIGFG